MRQMQTYSAICYDLDGSVIAILGAKSLASVTLLVREYITAYHEVARVSYFRDLEWTTNYSRFA